MGGLWAVVSAFAWGDDRPIALNSLGGSPGLQPAVPRAGLMLDGVGFLMDAESKPGLSARKAFQKGVSPESKKNNLEEVLNGVGLGCLGCLVSLSPATSRVTASNFGACAHPLSHPGRYLGVGGLASNPALGFVYKKPEAVNSTGTTSSAHII